jgi:bis(5'-nucleosyl)-tetraphosphatase (symmetrical)
MATWAIGDIQGCHTELLALLDTLRFDPAHDRLWLVGDLVNRGPDSLAVLRFAHGLGDRVVVTLGNHDLHLLAVAEGTGRKLKRRDTLAAVLSAHDRDELLDWLRHRPLLHHDAALGWTMVHAGLPPAWDLATARACAAEVETALRGPDHAAFFQAMYGDEPDRWSPALRGMDRLRYTVNALTRLRLVHPDGRLDFAWKGERAGAPAGLLPWFAHPERRTRGLPLVFGHWSTLGPVVEAGAHALDSGCVWGGSLTALRLDDGSATRVGVACRAALEPGAD